MEKEKAIIYFTTRGSSLYLDGKRIGSIVRKNKNDRHAVALSKSKKIVAICDPFGEWRLCDGLEEARAKYQRFQAANQ